MVWRDDYDSDSEAISVRRKVENDPVGRRVDFKE